MFADSSNILLFSNKVLKILSKLHEFQQNDKTTAMARAKQRYNIHGVSTSNISIQQPKKGHTATCKQMQESNICGHTALPVMSPYTGKKIYMISYVESGHPAPNANAAVVLVAQLVSRRS
jgi:hypothetical protein